MHTKINRGFTSNALIVWIVAVFYPIASECGSWTYNGENGTEHWSALFPTCAGQKQSPINIVTNATVVNSDLGSISKSWFDTTPTEMIVKNTGYLLQVNIKDGYTLNAPAVWDNNFTVAQFHIHWGADLSRAGGSEHQVNGDHYFGELHIVHTNTKYSSDIVATQADGLAVVGIFIQDDSPTNHTGFEHFLTPVTDGNVTEDNSHPIPPFSLDLLLPESMSYYRYSGGLTTPLCHESVTWTVLAEPVSISKYQANVLQTMLHGTSNSQSGHNFRPAQPLNGRKVYYYDDDESGGTGGATSSCCQCQILFLNFVTLFLLLLFC